ncbi:hypothetical protein TVAG_005680 [Trichomonas vaginalis G3]|uniref:PRP1 splicing factor N-terminal domain-containing protein n=1 Tax=Trichomonas vaginalis (strain ATCC PRA-98 / G3) TaxID=412133 RepID=A2FHQ3_TRIV3|nr:pre-mRNA splicing factor family [Trichomonas vaginalis G3]EAX95553.1 hypothetical protein TVAG_005680 [Trichomonas vaginalis G3]KAI5520763.1 pre-mRNA splicing factor family [Trichomonas vaginalis G3]|eukprot:XP_001308483.1 hypothetical protein [Trichomonas vaginalis G3]
MSDYPFPWGPPPPGYVPGLGRGATGFVSYIENAVIELQDEKALSAKMSTKKIKEIEKADNDADDFYNSMDLLISSRNKAKKKQNSEQEKTIFDETRDQFAEFTNNLKFITANDWANIPERGQLKNYRPKWELLTYASGRMITGDFSDSALSKEIRLQDQQNDTELEANKAMMAVSRAKNSVMNAQLSKLTKSSSTIDTSKYLQEIDIETQNRIQQYEDLDHAAQLYRQMTHYNKNDPVVWITRARIEEKRGKYDKAAKVALDGLSNNPESEELVLEAARLSQNDSQSILEASLESHHAQSPKIWLQLASLQNTEVLKISVLERALSKCPKSPMLWIAASNCDEESRLDVLKAGFQMNKDSKELFIAGLEASKSNEDLSFFISQKSDIKDDIETLITEANCEEKFDMDFTDSVEKALQIETDRDWITIAMESELKNCPRVASLIIRKTKIDDDMVLRANEAKRGNCIAVCESLLKRNAEEGNGWYPFLEFERSLGNLEAALDYSLNYIKEGDEISIVEISRFMDDEQALNLLQTKFEINKKSEKIALEIAKIFAKSDKDKAAEFSFSTASEINSSLLFSYGAQTGTSKTVTPTILKIGVGLFPENANLWLILTNLQPNDEEKCKVLQRATQECSRKAIIHIEFAKICKKIGISKPKIRALLERARFLCPNDESLWLYSAEFEDNEYKIRLLEESKSKVDHPSIIWARQIELMPAEQRLYAVKNAMEVIGEKREILLLIAIDLWRRAKIDESKRTFEKLSSLFPQWGDGWIYYLRFEVSHQNDISELLEKAANESSCGYIWEMQRANSDLDDKSLLLQLINDIPDPSNPDSSIFCNLFEL